MYLILLLIFFYSISSVVDLRPLGICDVSPWWCYFTYNLIHLSFVHLILNSIAFISYWSILKKYLNINFLIPMMIFVPVVSAYLAKYQTPTVGASALIYTLIGVYTASMPMLRRDLIRFVFLILFSFMFTWAFAPSINTKIHIVSFVISLLISLVNRSFIYAKA